MKVMVDLSLLARITRQLEEGRPVTEADIRDLRDVLSSGGGWTKANGYNGPAEKGGKP